MQNRNEIPTATSDRFKPEKATHNSQEAQNQKNQERNYYKEDKRINQSDSR